MLDKTILFGYAVINDSFTVNRILEENNKEAVSNNSLSNILFFILSWGNSYIVFNKKFVYTKLE